MNNFERQEEITELCVKYTNRELASELLKAWEKLEILSDIVGMSLEELLEYDQ